MGQLKPTVSALGRAGHRSCYFTCHRTFKRRRSGGGNLPSQGMCIISIFWIVWVSPFSLLACWVLNFLSEVYRISEDFSPEAVIVEWNWNFLSVDMNVYYVFGLCLQLIWAHCQNSLILTKILRKGL